MYISVFGHVIAVISKNVTASQAEAILTKLTHNVTGARIGNNVTISSTSLYLLHLPNDILSTIPTFVMNAGMGEGPNYLDPLGVIGDIAGMAFNFLVWVASGGLLLLFVHLVKEVSPYLRSGECQHGHTSGRGIAHDGALEHQDH
jgi:hypothetical protein